MIDIGKTFRYFAEQDLASAQNLISSGVGLNVAASLMQQALEKMLKYILSLKNIEAPRTHSLLALYETAYPDRVRDYRSRLRELNSMYFSMRYPNDDYYEVDSCEVSRLWDIFTEIYKELEADADRLEHSRTYDETTNLFG